MLTARVIGLHSLAAEKDARDLSTGNTPPQSLTECILRAFGIYSCAMTNRLGVLLYRDDVRWAAAEGVSETVIAAVLMLHERSVEEIAPKLSAAELEKMIKLVGRSPDVYPPGTLDVLKQRRALVSPEPPQQSGDNTRSEVAAEKQHAGTPCAQHTVTRCADPLGQPSRASPEKPGQLSGRATKLLGGV